MSSSAHRIPLVVLALLALRCSGGSPASEGGLPDGAIDRSQPDLVRAEAAVVDRQPDAAPYVPKAADIKFAAVHPLPSGEQILFNDWSPDPNVVHSMTPDGKTVTEVFRAFRVWSMSVSQAADRIAFACGDPLQEQHYGIKIGDAIQHTWLYDASKQTVSVLAHGNINDECHAFGPGDSTLYVCRRYDFTQDGSFKGWRIGRIDLPGSGFTFLTPEVPPGTEFHLSPQPTPDGKTLYFGRIQISGGKQQNAILRQALPSGTPEVVRPNAKSPTLSADGTRYVFQNIDDNRHLYVATVDGSSLVKVAAAEGTTARYSPDGKQIAYLVWDTPKNCAHIEAVKADGTEASAPRRLRDCSTSGEFITELDWITR
jgi:hypothetical protein